MRLVLAIAGPSRGKQHALRVHLLLAVASHPPTVPSTSTERPRRHIVWAQLARQGAMELILERVRERSARAVRVCCHDVSHRYRTFSVNYGLESCNNDVERRRVEFAMNRV